VAWRRPGSGASGGGDDLRWKEAGGVRAQRRPGSGPGPGAGGSVWRRRVVASGGRGV
jgi:hypothetical protein